MTEGGIAEPAPKRKREISLIAMTKERVTNHMNEYRCWIFPVPCCILKTTEMMRSSLIGKIEKAKRYAQEPSRVTFSGLTAVFHGENDDHKLSYAHGKWHCTCRFFSQWETCSHVMALQQILGKMLPKEALVSPMDTQPPEK
jgi:hypothetical protein